MHQLLPATPESVGEARVAVGRFAAGLEVDVHGVLLAVSEAVANVVTHAYSEGEAGAVELEAAASPFELTVVVRDQGRGLEADHGTGGAGFGLQIIRQVAQHVELADTQDGVSLTMGFRRGGAWSAR
jgi:anti-sigma regulatory factor (Ser/Thr protein kinase)